MPTQDERDAEQAKQWHDRLVTDHQEVIMKALTRKLDGDVHTAADICQKTLFTAWELALRDPSKVPEKEKERVWLFTITRNHLSNHRRQIHHLPVDRETLQHKLDRHQYVEDVAFARSLDPAGILAGLSSDDRLILDLKYVDDLTCEEIGRLLNLTPAAARQRLHRAQQRAAKLLKPPAGPSTQEQP